MKVKYDLYTKGHHLTILHVIGQEKKFLEEGKVSFFFGLWDAFPSRRQGRKRPFGVMLIKWKYTSWMNGEFENIKYCVKI